MENTEYTENILKDDFVIACSSLIPPGRDEEDEHAAMVFIHKCMALHPEWGRTGFLNAVSGGQINVTKFLYFFVDDNDKKSALFDATRYGNLDIAMFLFEELKEQLRESDMIKVAEESLSSYNTETIDWAFSKAPYSENLAREIMGHAQKSVWVPFVGDKKYIDIKTVKRYLERDNQP